MSESKAVAIKKVQELARELADTRRHLDTVRWLYTTLNNDHTAVTVKLKTAEEVAVVKVAEAALATETAHMAQAAADVARENLQSAIIKQADRKQRLEHELDDMWVEFKRRERMDEDTIEVLTDQRRMAWAFSAVFFVISLSLAAQRLL